MECDKAFSLFITLLLSFEKKKDCRSLTNSSQKLILLH